MIATRTICLIITAIALLLGRGAAAAESDCRAAVADMLEKYPESGLRDVYKSFFQDRFGPGHIVSDTLAARNYLRRELAETGTSALPYYEPAGNGRNYYRVSLAVINDGIISEDAFFKAFIESAGKVRLPEVGDWAGEWHEILKSVPADIENYAADKTLIDSVLASGKYAVHHSRRFNEAYHPHYRLIDKATFERELLPAILRAYNRRNLSKSRL